MQPPPSQSTSGSVPPYSSTLARMHTHISALFQGSSVHTSGPFTSSCRTPKSACPNEPVPSRGRLYIPESMARSPSHSRSPTSTGSVIDPTSSPARSTRPVTAHSYLRLIMSPALALQSTPASPTASPDTHEGLHQAGEPISRRRRHRRRRRHGTWERVQIPPRIQRGSVRRRIYSCLVSGISLGVVLTIYLALAISNTVSHQAFHVLMILMIIAFTILFCHSIIRLSMVMLRRPTDEEGAMGVRGRAGFEEYAQPDQPIRVVLARDEQLGISGTSDSLGKIEGPTLPPPAYGLWRCSVKADPNLLHWQHAVHPAFRHGAVTVGGQGDRPETARYPPSYESHGSLYDAPQAAARLTSPFEEAVLPLHPSERSRPYLI